jgi:uncharacterized protein (TIGR02996 family)
MSILLDPITKAASALRAGEPIGALEQLVGAWKESRDPRITRLIEALPSKLSSNQLGNLYSRKKLEHALRPNQTPQQLRLSFIYLSHIDNPRIASFALRLLQQGLEQREQLLARTLVQRNADPSHLPLLEQLDDPELAPLITRLQKLFFQKTTDPRLEMLDRLIQHPPLKLLKQIYQNPEDLQLRAVYADYLIENQDPRGEFIALQLMELHGKTSEESKNKALGLWRGFLNCWYPRLSPLFNANTTRCYAGFLDHVAFHAQSSALPTGDPGWSTVRSIDFGFSIQYFNAIPILAHPVCSQVQTVTGFASRHFRYGPQSCQVESLCLRFTYVDDLPYLLKCTAFPKLSHLTILDLPELPPPLFFDTTAPFWAPIQNLCLKLHGNRPIAEYIEQVHPMPGLQQLEIITKTEHAVFQPIPAGWALL